MFAYCFRSHVLNEKRPLVERIYAILTKRLQGDQVIEYSALSLLGGGTLTKVKRD
jgi:hypothetical protein